MAEIGVSKTQCRILWCDNIGAIYLSTNPVSHAPTKHIVIDIHFVHDKVASCHLQVLFIFSKDQNIADVFTKPLVSTRTIHLFDPNSM